MWSCALCLTSPFLKFFFFYSLKLVFVEGIKIVWANQFCHKDRCSHHIDAPSTYSVTYSRYVVSGLCKKKKKRRKMWFLIIPAVSTNISAEKDQTRTRICRHVFFLDALCGRATSWLSSPAAAGEQKQAEFWHFTSSRGHLRDSYITFMCTLSPDCCAVSCLAGYIYMLSVPEKYEM